MPYRWLQTALDRLAGVEPHEVHQALAADRRLPKPARSSPRVLAVYARTNTGRPLAVILRHAGGLDWYIIGARDMDADELAAFETWEKS